MSTRRKFIKTVAAGSAIATVSPNVLINVLDDGSHSLKQFFQLTDPTADEIKNTRLLEFPFFYVGAEPRNEENKKLLAALKKFAHRKRFDDYSPIESFISSNPNSTWNASLFANLGTELFKTGRYSITIDYLRKAWDALKSQNDEIIIEVANHVVAELARMYAWMGRMNDLELLFSEIGERIISGSSKELLTGAKEGLAMMKIDPGKSFKCGIFALASILSKEGRVEKFAQKILTTPSSKNGFSLTQVCNFSKEFGMNYQMAKREKGAAVIVPCVMNFKLEHYAAITEQRGNEFKLQDSTFGVEYTQWISLEVLENEASGYFLVPNGDLPFGWSRVDEQLGNKIWGKGYTGNVDPDRNTQYDDKKDGESGCNGMAVYNIHLLKVNLLIQDVPIGYTPPRGLPIYTKLSYNHREAGQPAIMNYSNFGKRWTFNWGGFIEDSGSLAPNMDTVLFDEEGGQLRFNWFNGKFNLERYSMAELERLTPDSYIMTMPDGSKKVFAFPDGTIGIKRRVFLTEIIDNTGVNKITLSYKNVQGGVRLVSVNDPNGLSTTFSYNNPFKPFQISKITDPFGRTATFAYDRLNRLIEIKDVINLRSSFTYEPIKSNAIDFISQMTTPYGNTKFLFEESFSVDPNIASERILSRKLTVTDINGDNEIVLYCHLNSAEYDDSEDFMPAGSDLGDNDNRELRYRNVFYWDKKTLLENMRDYKDARVYHFTHGDGNTTGGFLECVKYPLQSRIWFRYEGQTSTIHAGDFKQLRRVVRLIENHDGLIKVKEGEDNYRWVADTQAYEMSYNKLRMITKIKDPINRETTFSYDLSNLRNLTGIYQKEGDNCSLVSEIKYDDTFKNLPRLTRDGSGVTTQYQYNDFGQIKKVFLPNGLVIKYNYDNSGFLVSIQKGLPSRSGLFEWETRPITTKFTYKFYNNKKSNLINSITDPEGNIVKFDYDDMGRVTKMLYKDKTFEQYEYEKLDLKRYIDRTKLNITEYEYDAFRRVKTITGPVIGKGNNARPITLIEWCRCGSMSKLTDPNGNVTSFEYDIQGRLTKKIYADYSEEEYHYEEYSGRLKSIIDPNGQHNRFYYWIDDNLKIRTYTNAAGGELSPATPSVSYDFDPFVNRLTIMTDGLGTTEYSYVPYNQLGGGNIAKIMSSLHGTTTEFQYDNMGQTTNRIQKRTLSPNEIINSHDWKYDLLGRVSEEKNGLGKFAYEYMGSSNRLSTVTYPNQMKTIYNWYDQYAFPMLKSMRTAQGAQQLANFEYDYFPKTLNISKWKRQMGTSNEHENSIYNFDYDNLSRLYSADLKDQNNQPLKQYQYGYDKADNLLISNESTGNITKNFQVNNLNQAITLNNETLKYDKNGNLVEDEAKIYQWNAANQLVKIIYKGTNDNSQFYYDGLRRLVKLTETSNGNATEQVLHYNGINLCAEQNSQGDIERTHYAQGIVNGPDVITPQAPVLFNVRDHLGSIRGRIDISNNTYLDIIDYDAFGEVVSSSNIMSAFVDNGYADYLAHARSGLYITLFRPYSPNNSQWISRDPLGEKYGFNHYFYSFNNPISFKDSLGLTPIISAVDTSSPSGFIAYLLPNNNVKFYDFESLVNNVIAKAGEDKITELTIIAHGVMPDNPEDNNYGNQMQLDYRKGNYAEQIIGEKQLDIYKPSIDKLKKHLSKEAIIKFNVCYLTAKGNGFIQKFSNLTGSTVVGFSGACNAYKKCEGPPVIVNPR